MNTVFTSQVSFQDAARRAQIAGFVVVGQTQNKRGEFVVFARGNRASSVDWRSKI